MRNEAREITFRAGADIGGTFTDIVLVSSTGALFKRKQSSTPDDYSRGIAEGLEALLHEIGGTPGQVTELVHATTVATNTILEGKGARTALITTRGFRDVLEIARLRVPRLYDLGYSKPTPLALRRHRFELSARMRANGAIDTQLNLAELDGIVGAILRDKIEAVAVCLLHSYVNPAHEIAVRERLAEILPAEIYISCSCDVLPEIREYERTSTTVVNAYLGPIVRSYLGALTGRLRSMGIKCPVRIMHSAGGLMTAEAAIQKPAYIIESGPAAGVIAGAHMARLAGYRDVITVDMGGTTAKAAIIEAGEPARTTEYEVGAGINVSSKLVKGGGHAVKLPFIDVSEIGAGGGSLVGFDSGGLLTVGPESAGSVPGPVCYDKGNETPTLTDAFVTLGYLSPVAIAGGAVKINARKARDALDATVARQIGRSPEEAALGIQAIATATMSRAVKAVSTYRGRDPREFALFAFGGNGPMIAIEIAKTMGMKTVIVPPSPGVFSAVGLLFSSIEHEFTAADFGSLTNETDERFEQGFLQLEARVFAALEAEGYDREALVLERYSDLRYEGQAYELTVPTPASADDRPAIPLALDNFNAEHKRTYGHAVPTNPVELVSRRIKVRVANEEAEGADPWSVVVCTDPVSTRKATFEGLGQVDVPVIRRGHLVGQHRKGPMIVEEYDSTLVIPPGGTATIDRFGNIVVELDI
ncbi:hydantoinase/oxoprolinase family protein [Sphingomonas oligophenolica]|uniref:Hydantoinase/oxoprolinase family protein n=1 Tax=Sphingomonas oligophenolica TaxID=301154 RepID=A0ABU9Y1C8_9SPHN